jgi:hypothetical protein
MSTQGTNGQAGGTPTEPAKEPVTQETSTEAAASPPVTPPTEAPAKKPAKAKKPAAAKPANGKAKAPAAKATAKPASKPAKGKGKPAAAPAKAKGKAPATAKPAAKPKAEKKVVEKDAFGFKKGSLKSKAAAMYSRANGATLFEVKTALSSSQLNVLGELEGKGFKVVKKKEPGAGSRPITRYVLSGKPSKK